MDCSGIDLVHPVDRLPPGYFPYLFNVRVVQEGRLESRPGYTLSSSVAASLHSIRRLNYPSAYIDLIGAGTSLYAGVQGGAFGVAASGFSGNPLSLLTFRPDQSPESWMYVYDSAKQTKVDSTGTARPIGIAPPQEITTADYGPPAEVVLSTGQSTTGWTSSGAAGTITNPDRASALGPTIVSILYNSG